MTAVELLDHPPAIHPPAGFSLLRWQAHDRTGPGQLDLVLREDATALDVWVSVTFQPETTREQLEVAIRDAIEHEIDGLASSVNFATITSTPGNRS